MPTASESTHQFKGRRQGGFVMTYPMLAAIVKYPFASSLAGKHGKFGFFTSEAESYQKVAEELGIRENRNRESHWNMPATRWCIW